MITKVKVEDAVGMTLAHDITKVVPGEFKGPAFRRGHIIRTEDIPDFLKIGKEHVYVLKLEPGEVHEEEAAIRIAAAAAGTGTVKTGLSEGRVDLKAKFPGVLKIDVRRLEEINSIGDIIVVTLHNNSVCKKDKAIAGMRIIPLIIREESLIKLENICQGRPIIDVVPIPQRKVGVIAVGNEVYGGRIQDRFIPILTQKLNDLGAIVQEKTILPDDADLVAQTIIDFKDKGCDIIMACSGMSVDPDDMTPEGIRRSGAKVFFHGIPVLPGAMFLYSRLNSVPVLGIPACVLHSKTTVFDVLLPRILIGEEITHKDVIELGHGGFCRHCPECRYPICPLGK